MAKAVGQITLTTVYDGEDGKNTLQAILTNENHTLAADSSGVPISYVGAETTINIYDGTTDVTNQYTISKVDSDGITSSITNNTINVTSITNSIGGTVTINATKGSTVLTKVFTVSLSRAGTAGDANIIDIVASSQIFKSSTGIDGTFTPEYIYLYPTLSGVSFSKWQYSLDGITWNDVISGQNHLTINTFDSVANTLRIQNVCELYTNEYTSISFKCVSNIATVYDIATVTRLYDISDLKVGARNLLRFIHFKPYLTNEQSNLDKTNYITSGTATYHRDAKKNAGFYVDNISLMEPNTNYIIHFDAKEITLLNDTFTSAISTLYVYKAVTSTNDKVYMDGQLLGGLNESFNIDMSDGEYHHFAIKFKTLSAVENTSGNYDGHIIQFNKNEEVAFNVELKNIKWETGNVETDWTPAQEDMSITVSSSAPTNPYNNQMWYDSGTRGLFIYDAESETWIGADSANFISRDQLNAALLDRNRTWLSQPEPPYYAGDIWIVQDGADAGKIKTCLNTRLDGAFTNSDWFTPLTAYTTLSEFTNVLGTDPQEFSSESRSIVSMFNEQTKQIETTNQQVSSLAVKASSIEMTFSQSGTGNSLPNSSGQYETTYWKTQNKWYSEGPEVPSKPSVNHYWICTQTSNTYEEGKVYVYKKNNGSYSWQEVGTVESFLASINTKNYVSTVGTYDYTSVDTLSRDSLLSGTAFKLTGNETNTVMLYSEPFECPKSDRISMSFKVNNTSLYGKVMFRWYIASKYVNNFREVIDNLMSSGSMQVKHGEYISSFGVIFDSIKKKTAGDIISVYEYNTLPVTVAAEETMIICTEIEGEAHMYHSDGETWQLYDEYALKNDITLVNALDESNPDYSQVYILKYADFDRNNLLYWDRTNSQFADASSRSMGIAVSIEPTITYGSFSEVPEINEETIGNAFVYTGTTQTIDNVTYTNGRIYICNSELRLATPEISDTIPSSLDYGKYWQCPENMTDGFKTYIAGYYYMYNHAKGELYPITSSYISALIDTQQYYVEIPTNWTLVNYTTEQCEQVGSNYAIPVEGSALVGDIMISSGTDVKAWVCAAGENYHGKIIKFNGTDGILIYNPHTNYKRILNESADIAWRITSEGKLSYILWKLTESGMMARDVEIYGDLRLGYYSGTEEDGVVIPIISYVKNEDNTGIDEYIYSREVQ